MKDIIDTNGDLIKIAKSVQDKVINGVHYALSDRDLTEIAVKERAYQVSLPQVKVEEINFLISRSITDGGYGTPLEQLDMIYAQGLDAWMAFRTSIIKKYSNQ